jgi:hypothetical protein
MDGVRYHGAVPQHSRSMGVTASQIAMAFLPHIPGASRANVTNAPAHV